ncbi:hypothetical protein Hdeb2414_s1042g00976121 [Helianthus debilis subsp. tardiflorus]
MQLSKTTCNSGGQLSQEDQDSSSRKKNHHHDYKRRNLNRVSPNLRLVKPSRFNHGFDIDAIHGTKYKRVLVSSYKWSDLSA